MSLLGDLAKQAIGNAVSNAIGGHAAPAQGAAPAAGGMDIAALAPIAMTLIQNAGGVEALMNKLKAAGLGDQLASWIGTGANLPVSGEQIQAALGGHLDQAAQAAGHDPSAVATGIAQVLPGIIDKLTPSGQAPAGGLMEQGMQALLKGGLGKIFG